MSLKNVLEFPHLESKIQIPLDINSAIDNRERIRLPSRDGHSNLFNILVTTPGFFYIY